MVIFHGSENIIDKPIYGKGKSNNDYGRGFYCTEDYDLACEWSVDENRNGFVNSYDVIRGYRADDSYFAYAQDFISNTISLEQLSRAMHPKKEYRDRTARSAYYGIEKKQFNKGEIYMIMILDKELKSDDLWL